MTFACGHGHNVTAQDGNGKQADLEGYFCPLCMGAIVGYGDMIDSRILAPVQETHFANKTPAICSMQQIIDAGLNAFALQLFAESVAGKTDAKTFKPFAFNFRNIKITLEPEGEVDTTHH